MVGKAAAHGKPGPPTILGCSVKVSADDSKSSGLSSILSAPAIIGANSNYFKEQLFNLSNLNIAPRI